jgi:hypothetical protein
MQRDALAPLEAEGLEGAEVRPDSLADQFDESEVFAFCDADPALVLTLGEPNGDEYAPAIALRHAIGKVRTGHL